MTMMIEHVQLTHPEAKTDAIRDFWTGVMGFEEVEKPPLLRDQVGGGWFRRDEAEVHIGIDPDHHPMTIAHPAFMVDDLDALSERLRANGHAVKWDERIPTRRRFFSFDPAGNRLEFFKNNED